MGDSLRFWQGVLSFWWFWLPADPASKGGGVPFFSPANPAFGLLFCPLSPRPPSPAGKGVTKVISCKGLRPLHPRGLNPGGTYNPSKNRYPAGGVPFSRLLTPPLACFSAPYPPDPLPGGKGEIFSFLMQGASPLASPGAEPMVRRKTDRNRFPASGAAVHLFGRGL